MDKMIDLNKFADGALNQKVHRELQKVIDNIHDPNTNPTAKRSITIKIGFNADEEREYIDTEISVTSSLAGHKSAKTKMLTAKQDGKATARELVSGIKGQMFMDVAGDGQIKTDSGEPVEEEHENTKKVVSFKGAN